jgi:hypothetical protein
MAGPLDKVLDAFVYVPVGLAVSAREALPELAARGRERVAAARIIGQFTVQQGQAEASRLVERIQHPHSGSDISPMPEPSNDAPEAPRAAPRSRPKTSGPASADLAIPGYDSLSASQVLPRLEGLEPGELEAVRRYESDHRARKTILARIVALQAR